MNNYNGIDLYILVSVKSLLVFLWWRPYKELNAAKYFSFDFSYFGFDFLYFGFDFYILFWFLYFGFPQISLWWRPYKEWYAAQIKQWLCGLHCWPQMTTMKNKCVFKAWYQKWYPQFLPQSTMTQWDRPTKLWCPQGQT